MFFNELTQSQIAHARELQEEIESLRQQLAEAKQESINQALDADDLRMQLKESDSRLHDVAVHCANVEQLYAEVFKQLEEANRKLCVESDLREYWGRRWESEQDKVKRLVEGIRSVQFAPMLPTYCESKEETIAWGNLQKLLTEIGEMK